MMEAPEKGHRRHRIWTALPIRVRGMSSEQRFFDEQTETLVISDHEVMARIRSLPDLDTEIHITALKNDLGGIFRVAWLGTQPHEGFFEVGLEKMETDGDLWEATFPLAANPQDELLAQCWLECRRCHQKLLSTVPEAEGEFVREGFRVARPCERCKATTAWEFVAPPEETSGAQSTDGNTRVSADGLPIDLRGKGRAPLRIQVKVTRKKYGSALDDVCHTENVSRTGAYFFSTQNYEVGEIVSVILPYKESDIAIPLPARVVRLDQPSAGYYHGVAIQLLSGENHLKAKP